MKNQQLRERNISLKANFEKIENDINDIYDKEEYSTSLINCVEPATAIPKVSKAKLKGNKHRHKSNPSDLLEVLPEYISMLKNITEHQAGHISILEGSIDKLKHKKQEVQTLIDEIELEKKEFVKAASQVETER